MKSGIISLKIIFHLNKLNKDGLFSQCKSCVIQKQKIFDSENRENVLYRNRGYQFKNHDKILARKRIYSNTNYKKDFNFRLIWKTRSRIRQALTGKISSSTINILGIDIETYRKKDKASNDPRCELDK